MEKGQIVELTIEDMSAEGRGIGKIYDNERGFAVFVQDTVVGDRAKVELTKVKKNYAFGRVSEMLALSQDRQESFCPHSGLCGGCVYSQLSYEAQLALKEKQVREKLVRLGGLTDPVIMPIIGMGGIGAGIYAFLNRLLIPTGLHHALNNVFWFDTIGLGDLTHFWAGETSADVGWSLGMYMSGFFPCMMFGIAGAALAMVKTAKNKKAAIGLVLSAAICAFVCGVTEPFEFGFMFLCFPLYVVYSALYGIFTIITYYSGFRAGFCFSAGATDLIFSASLPAAAKTWMIIPLGIAAFLVFYFVFYFAITKFDLKTPGREDDDEEAEKKVVLANNNYTEVASAVLAAVGGKENVKDVGYCATRLRFEVKDNAKVDEKAVKAAGAAGVIRPSKNACQVIIGTKVQFVYDELKKML